MSLLHQKDRFTNQELACRVLNAGIDHTEIQSLEEIGVLENIAVLL